MSEFRRRLPELLAKAWAGERIVISHRPRGQGLWRLFLLVPIKEEEENAAHCQEADHKNKRGESSDD